MFISYKKEEIKIKLSKADWNKINSLLIKYGSYKKKFNDIKKEEKNNLYKFQCYREKEIISKHNFLVKEFLKELANEFKVFKFFSVTIFITGSFARFSNKTNSDVDIINKLRRMPFDKKNQIYNIICGNNNNQVLLDALDYILNYQFNNQIVMKKVKELRKNV